MYYNIYLHIDVVVELVAPGTCGIICVSSSFLPQDHYGDDDDNDGDNQYEYDNNNCHHDARRSSTP